MEYAVSFNKMALLYDPTPELPRIMLLIGMKISLMKYPISPITTNPTEQALKILMYSKARIRIHLKVSAEQQKI